jgi:O-antigen/teichoic acid export membrane protein
MHLKGTFHNIQWGSIEASTRIFSSVLTGIVVAKYLGPTEFGTYVLVISYFGIFGGIASLGMDQVLLKRWSDSAQYDSVEVLGNALLARMIVSFSLIIPFIVFIYSTIHTLEILLVTVLGLFSQILFSISILKNYFIANMKGSIPAKVSLISISCGMIGKITGILFQLPLEFFILMLALEIGLNGLLFLLFFSKSSLWQSIYKTSVSYSLDLIRESWPLFLSGLLFVANLHLDKIIIWNLIPDKNEFGVYGFASRIYSMFHLLPGLILSSSMPLLIKKDASNFFTRNWIKLCGCFLVSLAILSSIFFFKFGDQVIEKIVGVEFVEASIIISVLMLNNVFVSIVSCWSYINVINNKSVETFWLNAFITVFSLIFLFLLVKTNGMLGAAFGILAGNALAVFVMFYLKKSRKTFDIN